ncbi:MAG: hypothetical protein ACUVX8_08515 [Candidatus Zipacnadales bacterium]
MRLLLAGGLAIGWMGRLVAAPAEIADARDREILAAFLEHVEGAARYCTPERMQQYAAQPEDITWVGSRYLAMSLVAYELTEEPRYLDMTVERLDTLLSCLTTGPDGFQGWLGLPLELFRDPEHPDRHLDCQLTDFVMTGMIADFARIIRADPGLQATYGPKATQYLALAENHLVRKWDVRGNYRDLGDMGAVYVTETGLKPTKAELTQPNNKHTKIILALLSLYAATGRDEYAIKALKLGTRFKRTLTLVDGRYQWNYWNPAGAWDIDPTDPSKWKHWIGAEHRAGYYNLSVEQAVVLYEHGLVFDRTDIDRFVRTQLEICWNGDTENPAWFRTDGRPADEGHVYLSMDLAPFDQRIYDLAFGPRAQASRLGAKDHPWQGGPVAMEWLKAKYLTYPRWKTGEPAETATMQPFLSKPENHALVERLAFTVEPPGYQPPLTPAAMKPMPGR